MVKRLRKYVQYEAKRRKNRDRKREKRRQQKILRMREESEVMSVGNGMQLYMTFEIEKDAFYSDEYEGNGADVRSYGGENSGRIPLELDRKN